MGTKIRWRWFAFVAAIFLAIGLSGATSASADASQLGVLTATPQVSCYTQGHAYGMQATFEGTTGDLVGLAVDGSAVTPAMVATGGVQSVSWDSVDGSGTHTVQLFSVTNQEFYPQNPPVTYTLNPCTTPPVVNPTVNLTSSAKSVVEGKSFVLSWTSKDAKSLTASGAWSGSKQVPSGTETVTPSQPGTYTYTLTADGAKGSTPASSSVVVTVTKKVTPPPTCDSSGKISGAVNGAVGTVKTKSGLPVCDPVTVWGSLYQLPKSWDGNGWNKTAAPQNLLWKQQVTIQKGQSSASVTAPIAEAGCPGYQFDLGTGVPPNPLTYPSGTPGWLAGEPTATTKCTTPPPPTKVTATAPTATCDSYTIPSTTGVEYLVNGVVVPAGTYPGSGTVTVTAKAKDGYVLEGQTSWTFTFTGCSTPPPTNNPSIMAKASCGQVKFSNPNGYPVEVWAGNKSMTVFDHVVVPAHGSKVVKTTRTTLYYQIAWKGTDPGDVEYSVNVPQNCGTPPTSPPPTSPTSSPTSPTSSPTGSPTSTSSPTSTGSHSSTPTGTSTSTSGHGGATNTTPAANPPSTGGAGSGNTPLLAGFSAAVLAMLAGAFLLRRRLHN